MMRQVCNNTNSLSSARFAQFARLSEIGSNSDENFIESITIPSEVYENLPSFLRRACSVFDSLREKDVFFVGCLGVLSGCFNSVGGLYSGSKVYSNLNCLVVAPPSSGKGSMKYARILGNGIHRHLAQDSNFEFNPQPLLFFPANSSSSAIIRHLKENSESGIFFETEADSLTGTLKQDWGGYSDMLRKAFHHEVISLSRKGQREHYEINEPKLSLVLSGTPGQVSQLINSSENGLFSRMIFYAFEGTESWRNVGPRPGIANLSEFFSNMGIELTQIYKQFQGNDFHFELTTDQWDHLNNRFSDILDHLTTFVDKDTNSLVKRMGLIQFRIAMILSILRHYENGGGDSTIVCTPEDYEISAILSEIFLEHSMIMFHKLPREDKGQPNAKTIGFFSALPNDIEFSREDAVEIGAGLGIKTRTCDKYLERLVQIRYLDKPDYGRYRKT